MRQTSLAFAAAVALASIGCGGSSGTGLAPDTLDHDASAAFAGHWSGTLTLASNGQTPTGRVLRWGADGIAFATDAGQLVLTHDPHP